MKGLIIFSNGMEDNESLSTLSLLRRAGIIIDSATIEDNLLVKTAFGINVYADKNLHKINSDDYQFLIVPGGGYVSKVIDNDVFIKKTIKAFHDKEKDIYAICAAPRFLGQLNLLNGLDYTAFPGSEKDALNGNYKPQEKVVVTPKIITARSAGSVIEFVYEIVKKNINEQEAKSLIKSIMY
ncbi:DJ-1/PfpI family protein [Acholeplasma granularum]|uniref:DJ-1/PfpI family protein n=1 Tax=Acholeplasma granularum TaxID=264635 RepID=UPI0004715AF6|nr:DJ-1/PfpI family protein [Acholeplasma granularum]